MSLPSSIQRELVRQRGLAYLRRQRWTWAQTALLETAVALRIRPPKSNRTIDANLWGQAAYAGKNKDSALAQRLQTWWMRALCEILPLFRRLLF